VLLEQRSGDRCKALECVIKGERHHILGVIGCDQLFESDDPDAAACEPSNVAAKVGSATEIAEPDESIEW
jgi:hypothetical protein